MIELFSFLSEDDDVTREKVAVQQTSVGEYMVVMKDVTKTFLSG